MITYLDESRINSKEFCFIPWWLIDGRNKKSEYPILSLQKPKHTIPAYRFITETYLGKLRDGHDVLHRCGRAGCCNPKHLYVGTHQSNMHDLKLHNQSRKQKKSEINYSDRWQIKPLDLSTNESLMPEIPDFTRDACIESSIELYEIENYISYNNKYNIKSRDEINKKIKEKIGILFSIDDFIGLTRHIYQIFKGPIMKNEILYHSCKNRNCINPYHLYIYTAACRYACKEFFDHRVNVTLEAIIDIKNKELSCNYVCKKHNIHPQTYYEYKRRLKNHQ